jgi:hypothetical protein
LKSDVKREGSAATRDFINRVVKSDPDEILVKESARTAQRQSFSLVEWKWEIRMSCLEEEMMRGRA